MLKKIFHDNSKSKFSRICMENHLRVTGWQKLFFTHINSEFSATVAIANFEI